MSGWTRERYGGRDVLRRHDRFGFDVRFEMARDDEDVHVAFYSPGRDCEQEEEIPCTVLAEVLRERGWTVVAPATTKVTHE